MQTMKQRNEEEGSLGRNAKVKMMSLTARKPAPSNSYFETFNKMNTLMTKI